MSQKQSKPIKSCQKRLNKAKTVKNYEKLSKKIKNESKAVKKYKKLSKKIKKQSKTAKI